MKKITIMAISALIILVLFVFFGGNEKSKVSEQVVYRDTINISRTYLNLRVKTSKVLSEASKYSDYSAWNKDMSSLIEGWKELESRAGLLEKQANFGNEKKVSFGIINIAEAYTKDEISNVFDKAPAGRKIRTLAKYLGVDAKRAFKILKNDQEFVKADAWNKAGDTFKKLEVSATVIKDGCKVAGYVGAAVMTGGVATAAEGTIMIVTGTDLMLEVGEDTARIMLGDNHKTVKAISGIRSYTDPAASILSITDIPKNIAKGAKLLDKVGVLLIQADQIRSMVQDGKLLGINITPDSKVEIALLEKDEVGKWMDDNKIIDDSLDDYDNWLDEFDDLGDWLDEFDSEVEEDEEVNEEVDIEETEEIEEDKEVNKMIEDVDMGKAYSKDGKVSISIVSPNGALSSGGTQLWEIKVDGYEYLDEDNKYIGEKRGYKCYSDFYTEYDAGVEPWMNLSGCKNAHGVPGKNIFIGKPPGKLRLVVRVEFLEQDYGTNEWGDRMQNGKKVVETISAERIYEISPYFSN